MTTATVSDTIGIRRHLTFEDLRGLRAEGYIRDSTLDQRDGFGPELQRRAIGTFARSYGLELGSVWHTDFITGTSTLKRAGFQQVIRDAELDRLDVLLVYHTSRFARNRADAIRYKARLAALGVVIVFVSQGIISGSDPDFLNEGINEVLDEHYSRNLSRWVSDGYAEKARHGYANGLPPLGYKSETLANGNRERKVPDPETMPVLLELLRCYASGRYSLRTLADHLNARGHRTSTGRTFSQTSVEAVVSNRFYEGKAVYHPGLPDEKVRDGIHEVPSEVKELWISCQEVRARRRTFMVGPPRSKQRAYPFSKITECAGFGARYGAKANRSSSGRDIRLLVHGRDYCGTKPHSIRVDNLSKQFQEGVLPYVGLVKDWKRSVLQAISHEPEAPDQSKQRTRAERALENLRKQHLWGDIADAEYRAERRALERQMRVLTPAPPPTSLPDLDRAAKLLNDLPAFWSHPGATERQREDLARELLQRATVSGRRLIAIEPKPEYKPLFGYLVFRSVRNRTLETLPESFPSGDSWRGDDQDEVDKGPGRAPSRISKHEVL